ncbi:MAG: ABC transporter permease [Chloroflexota bacterium]
MQSLLAAWRVSLQRTRADWPIVAAAWLIVLLAATLLAAGPIYSSAVSLAGLHRVLDDANVADANIEVSARIEPESAAATLDKVAADLQRSFAAIGVEVIESAGSDSYALPNQDPVRDLTTLGFLQGVEEHAILESGSWTVSSTDDTIQLAILDTIAEDLSLKVGDRLSLTSRLDPSQSLNAQVVGVYRPNDPGDPYWWADPTLLEGVMESAQYRTFGPMLTTRENVLGPAAGRTVPLTWHAFPQFDRLTIDQIGPLQTDLAGLADTLAASVPDGFPVVRTDLAEILTASERSLLVSRTGILLLMAQLAILAGYAIVLTAALIVDHRRVDTALLRSRGAGPLQVGGLALAEGLLLALPAGIAGPWLAAAALKVLNLAGPLAGIGLRIEPHVTGDAYVAAISAAVACAVLLVLPALIAARSFAAEQAGRSRHETRTLGQRLGLDVALLAITVVGVWQLRLYGAPLTRTVHGVLGLDPLLVAAPAIGLLTGGVVALRLLPLLAQAAEAIVVRGRDLVGSLGARQLARRPLRYTRASLLLMLAMSMGVFAVSYASTWTNSQRDQAQFQVGSDLRLAPARGPGALPAWALSTAFASVDGVRESMPVERQRIQVRPGADAGELLAVDADVVPQVVSLRADLSRSSPGATVGPLIDERPVAAAVPVDGSPQRLLVGVTVALDRIGQVTFDPETGQPNGFEESDPAALPATPVALNVFVRDARGLIHRFAGEPTALSADPLLIEVPLAAATAQAREAVASTEATLSYPIEVIGLDLVISLPGGNEAVAGTIGLGGISASDDPTGDLWRPLSVDAAGEWRMGWSQGPGAAISIVPAEVFDGRSMTLSSERDFGSLPGVDQFGHGVTVSLIPSGLLALAASDLATVVNQAFLNETSTHVGDRVSLDLEGGSRDARIVGALSTFPATDPGRALAIVDLASLDLFRFQAAHATRQPTEWWIRADDAAAAIAVDPPSAEPFARATVISRIERTASLSADPLALGIIGALALGFVVAGLFAVIGLAASAAVSARQRRGEFALLRALGLSGGQLSGWLWLENASLVVVSLVAGTGLGLLIGWVVLPYITVTQQATTPFPPVLVETPWATILVLEAVTAGALALTVIGLAAVLRRAGVGSVLRMGGD